MTNSSSALSRPHWLQNIVHIVRGIVLVAISAAIIWGAGQVSITIPGLAAATTAQTLAVMAIAAFLGSSVAVTSVVAFVVADAIIVGGPLLAYVNSHLLGPDGGYMIGLIALAGIVGEAADRGAAYNFIKLLIVLVLGEIALFALSLAWLYFTSTSGGLSFLGGLTSSDVSSMAPQDIFSGYIMPVLPFEAAKVIIVTVAAPIVFAVFKGFRKS